MNDLTQEQVAVLAMLRDLGPRRLSALNEEAVDLCFKARPRLVFIHTYGGDDPLLDITSEGLRKLAAWELRTESTNVGVGK